MFHWSPKPWRLPLAPRCIELLGLAEVLSAGSEFVFPGRSNEKPMSNMVLLMTMRRMKSGYTVHGFRSAFRDWASERTSFPREICEAALAHMVRDKTEAAYRRGTYSTSGENSCHSGRCLSRPRTITLFRFGNPHNRLLIA